MAEHFFEVSVQWTGNAGTGTSGYKDYRRDNELSAGGKQIIAGSADKAFHGDRSRWNPEELLIAALSQCHMLSFCTWHPLREWSFSPITMTPLAPLP